MASIPAPEVSSTLNMIDTCKMKYFSRANREKCVPVANDSERSVLKMKNNTQITVQDQSAANACVQDTSKTVSNVGTNRNRDNTTQVTVAIYCRTARRDGSTDGVSITQQHDVLQKFVSRQGWNLAGIYVDYGYAGNNFQRPDFQRLLRDVEAGKMDCIVVKTVDRIGRGSETERYTDFFFQHDIRFIALFDGVDTKDGYDQSLNSLHVVNGLYQKLMLNRARMAKCVLAEEGKYSSGQAPYGYMKSPDDKHRLVSDPEVASIVKRIFTEYASGSSVTGIKNKFNTEGINSPHAYKSNKNDTNAVHLGAVIKWSSSTISAILRNPVYIGKLVSGKSQLNSIETGKRSSLPQEEWTVIDFAHEPIISQDLWDAVQTRLSTNSRGRRL